MTDRFPRYPKQHLLKLIQLESKDLFAILSFAVMAGLLSLATPVAVQSLVNTIAFGILIQPLVVLMLILFGCLAINSVLYALQLFVAEMIQRRIFVRLVSLSVRNISHALRMSETGERIGWVNYYFEIMSIQKAWTNLLLDGLSYGLQTIIGLVLLAFYHPVLLAFDVLIITTLYLIFTVLGSSGVQTAIEKSKAKHEFAKWMQALARNTLTSRSAWEWILQKSDQLTCDYLAKSDHHFKVVFKQQVAILALYAVANSALLGLGGWMVIERQLTLGQLIAAELILNAMLSGLTRLGKSITSYYDLMAGMDKISYLIDLPIESQDGQRLSNPETIAISGKGTQIIEPHSLDIKPHILRFEDFELHPGQEAYITSCSDLETETLIDSLRGVSIPATGHLMMNGVNYNLLHPDQLNSRISVAFKPEWFEVSILQNLMLGQVSLSLERVQQTINEFPVSKKLERLPAGLETQLSLDGCPLSIEDLWQINVIRELLCERAVLILGLPLEAQLWPSLDKVFVTIHSMCRHRIVIWVSAFSHPLYIGMKQITASKEVIGPSSEELK